METVETASPPQRMSAAPRGATARWRTAWTSLTGAAGLVMGLVPHILHHITPIVGAAVLTGAAGTTLSAAVGLAASAPMLIRLRRRFRSWWAPVIALIVFSGAFLVSTLVIGPAISGAPQQSTPGTPATSSSIGTAEHEVHHATPESDAR